MTFVDVSGTDPPTPEPERTAEQWLKAVIDAERRAELLTAFDLAERALEEHPTDLALAHRAVLVLARTGSTLEAARKFGELGLSAVDTEDIAALAARIEKDIALEATGDERVRKASLAATAYLKVARDSGGYYPMVNSATLSLVAGDWAGARMLATEALDLVVVSGQSSYYAKATEAEAYLLLGHIDKAQRALEQAARLHHNDFGALSTTRRQLRMVCALTGTDLSVLAPLAGPAVVHYCGHRIADPEEGGRFQSHYESDVFVRISEVVNRLAPGFAYGSLASGGDILWAEALLRVGAELHVVLPFALEEFVATSVSPAGSDWVQRFNRCLDAASSISYATLDAYLGDEVLFGYCAQLAMGLALLRARFLDAEVCQLALWDGAPSSGVAGTAADVAAWRNTGHKLVVISPVASSSNGGKFGPRSEEETLSPSGFKSSIRRDSSPSRRLVRAMIIGDVRGFSKLTDEKLPVFSELVMGAIAEVLRSYQREIEYRNTWGDALFVMFCDGPSAARCALELQEAMADLDLADACLPPHLALRLSAHIGPVVPITDPVLQVPSFLGSHVNRTARIEPVTPPGAVYVTEAFAAALELARCGDLGFDYVGHMPAAKDYGRLRMYRLRRRRML